MKFKEWLNLNELQSIGLPQPTSINGILADSIDFRMEDWQKGYNPAKNRPFYKSPPKGGGRFMNGSFAAPLTQGNFLNVILGNKDTTYGATALALATDQVVMVAPKPFVDEDRILPSQWFDFAVFYLGQKVVKPPEWPRGDYEKGDLAIVDPI